MGGDSSATNRGALLARYTEASSAATRPRAASRERVFEVRSSTKALSLAICAIGLGIGFRPGAASAAPAAVDALLACRHVTSDAARLACFDRQSAALAKSASAGSGSPPASAARADSRASLAAAGLSSVQTFGLAPLQIAARQAAAENLPQRVDHITARITALASAADGREIFTLDNHEVWVQLEAGGGLHGRVGDSVRISRGWLGSYWLGLKSRWGCKVTRIR